MFAGLHPLEQVQKLTARRNILGKRYFSSLQVMNPDPSVNEEFLRVRDISRPVSICRKSAVKEYTHPHNQYHQYYFRFRSCGFIWRTLRPSPLITFSLQKSILQVAVAPLTAASRR